jgi:UDP-2,3-diacylglucosamine pyrophosphatase LpxH
LKNKIKRKVDIVVLSDVHLGTYGCHAKQLLNYLKSVNPGIIILNGDIIDIWQFKKNYWPKSHMKVVKHLMQLASKKVKIYYITGNHDELLRKFSGFKLGSFQLENKLLLQLDNNEQALFFHGDVFDVTIQYSRWIAKLGAYGYDTLIKVNTLFNYINQNIFRKDRVSFSKTIKNSVKKAICYINDFEQAAANFGILNQYQYVICGHIHQPQIRKIETEKGSIVYMNSGDWIENLSALEYYKGCWSVYYHEKNSVTEENISEEEELCSKLVFQNLLQEFKILERA